MGDHEISPPLLGLLLRLANQRWSAQMDSQLADLGVHGLTAAHARVIPFVPPEGASIQDLADRAKVRKQTMSQSVDQLIAAGVVERRADPDDRRASLIVLTRAGRAIRPMSRTAGRAVERAWADEIGAEALQALRTSLMKLVGDDHPTGQGDGTSGPAT